MLGAPIGGPAGARSGPSQAAFGGDQQVLGIWIEGLGDQLLADVRPVGIRGIDQVDAELECPSQQRDCLVVVCRRAPDAGTGDPHGSEAEPAHGAIADRDRAGILVSDRRHPAASKASFSSWSARSLSPRLTWRIDQDSNSASSFTTS